MLYYFKISMAFYHHLGGDMRQKTRKPIEEMQIDQVKLDSNSRDDIPQILRGLQYVFLNPILLEQVVRILDGLFPKEIDLHNGRPGMDSWSILVMGVLRLNLNCDYDRLHNLVNNHKTIRQILGHGVVDDQHCYYLQTLKDNVSLLTPEMLDQINQVVVNAGHVLIKNQGLDNDQLPLPDPAVTEKLRGRCDSFVVETNVEYPTDTRLLFEALRKVIELLIPLCRRHQVEESIGSDDIKPLKKLWRRLQKLKASTSKDEAKQASRQQEIIEARQAYLDLARQLVERAERKVAELEKKDGINKDKLLKIKGFMNHARRQIDQTDRRVLQGQKIPHPEKVFSIFKPYTEWINKGKAGVPVELGVMIGIVEDQHHFILYHRVMQQEVDVDVAVRMIQEAKQRFPALSSCSVDQGFHSPGNQRELSGLLETVILPKKGRLSKKDQERQQEVVFIEGRRQHAAVESAINALEVHGLDRCPDQGLPAFKRYVALAVVARNLQILGRYVQQREQDIEKERCKIAA
jgi:IS5 family transposase